MSNEAILNTARALIDAFNAHDLNIWERSLADDFVGEYPMARGLGKAQARAFNESFLVAFPDLSFTLHKAIANGESVALHWTGGGTQNGPLQTTTGQTIPPTGKRGTISGMFLVDVKDGKIVRERTYWDELELMSQLGLMPAS
jgi:steroid delta-isomerase-like uncharacterized protein